MKPGTPLRAFEWILKGLGILLLVSTAAAVAFPAASGLPLLVLAVAINFLVVMSWMGFARFFGPGGIEERVLGGSLVRCGFFVGEFIGARFAFFQFENSWTSPGSRVTTMVIFALIAGVIASGIMIVLVRIYNWREFLRELQ